ncbi:hypothetical protein PR048_029058 [Dryococelus australis]|uniref:Ribosomal protein S4 n=1 Tax=Dryococelus australis TaxID=614101 RepID=A0ABQ9GCW5_9NEOP|nr:hypothetical protein PR048_029058 [Dryococelus australis]
MKPYALRSLTLPKRVYNYRLSRSRRVVKNAFGTSLSRFRIYHSPIQLEIESASVIISQGLLDAEHVDVCRVAPGSWRRPAEGAVQAITAIRDRHPTTVSAQRREEYCNYFNINDCPLIKEQYGGAPKEKLKIAFLLHDVRHASSSECLRTVTFFTAHAQQEKNVSLLASQQDDPGSIPGRVTPNFYMWESCLTMPLVGGFSRGSPVSPAPSFRRYSIPQLPSSALKTSMLRVAQISSLTYHTAPSPQTRRAPEMYLIKSNFSLAISDVFISREESVRRAKIPLTIPQARRIIVELPTLDHQGRPHLRADDRTPFTLVLSELHPRDSINCLTGLCPRPGAFIVERRAERRAARLAKR